MHARLAIFAAVLTLGTTLSTAAYCDGGAGKPLTSYPACTPKTPINSEAAHGAYIAGKGSFDVAEYGRALDLFKDAYRRDCSKHELLIIIARAYELSGNRPEAIHALETYLERVPNAQDGDVQRQHIANLKQQIAAAEVSTAPAPAPPPPPPPVVPPPAMEKREHTAVPWALAGFGVATAVVGFVVYESGVPKVERGEGLCGDQHQSCPSNPTPAQTSVISDATTGTHLENVGAVVMGVGAAAIVGGLLWHFIEPTGDVAVQTALRVTPNVNRGFAGLSLDARF
jgi:hypothetical protein